MSSRLSDADLDRIEQAYRDGRESTHWDGCRVVHPECAVVALVAEVRALTVEQDRLHEGIRQHREAMRESDDLSESDGQLWALLDGQEDDREG